MDPITLVLTAVASAAKDTVSEAVKDSYAGLKFLIVNHFKGDQQAKTTLDSYEKDPETWEKPMEKALTGNAIQADSQVLDTAKKLLELMRSEKQPAGKLNVVIEGPVQGGQFGEFNEQTNNFGVQPPKP